MSRSYNLHFLGCKANQSDAYSYAGILQRSGWRESLNPAQADLILVQTCTVTMSADAQGRQLARKLKRENPGAKILLTGCYAQRAESELSAIPEIDYVIGNLNPRKFDLLEQIAGRPVREEYPDFPMPADSPRTRVYIKIQDGCDARCSYCIIPSVRGRSRSLPPAEVLRRVEHYRDMGYREMIFTGISMGGYGKDLHPATSLAQLIAAVEKLAGKFKVRLSSVEPEEIDNAFIEAFSASRRFQPHLHLPLQSASDTVLKKMRRQYLFARYDSILERLFSRMPDLNLGTDLLVGFPAEDEHSFEKTYRYVEQAPFAYAHVFPFSPRPDTPAAEWRAGTHASEVTRRAARLRELAGKKNIRYRKNFIGRPLEALVLGQTGEALTGNYIRVKLPGEAPQTDFVSISINKVDADATYGAVIQ